MKYHTKLLILISAVCAITSCGPHKVTVKEALQEEAKMLTLYTSGDARKAEDGLLNYRKKMLEWRDDGGKLVDYDHELGITDARLYALYQATGNDKATTYFVSSANYLNQCGIAHGGEPRQLSQTNIIEVVALADRNLAVKWKTNKFVSGDNRKN